MSDDQKNSRIPFISKVFGKPALGTIFNEYPRNATYPADPSLVPQEQRQITETIQREVIHYTPKHFSPAMVSLAQLAQLSTDWMLTTENQSSFNEAKTIFPVSPDARIQSIRDKYARGLAVGGEVLEMMIALDLDTVGVIARTFAFQDIPEDLKEDIQSLYEMIVALQTPNDVMGTFNKRRRIKMLDRMPGQGGLESILVSDKLDFATIGDRSYVVTQRDRYFIDIREMPIKWRGALRKLVSTWTHNNSFEAEKLEDRSRSELFERILDLPNPENPEQTLRTVDAEAPFIYNFSKTIYSAKTELTSALDSIDDSPFEIEDDQAKDRESATPGRE